MINKKNAHFVFLNDEEKCKKHGIDVQQQKNAILNFLMDEKRVVIINVKNNFINYIKDNYKTYYEEFFPKDDKVIYIHIRILSVKEFFFTGQLYKPRSLEDDNRGVEKFEDPVDFPMGLKLTLPIDLVYSASIL